MRFGKFIILLVFTLSSLCSFGEKHNFCDECDEFGCMEKYIDEFIDGVHYVYTAHLHERSYHDENDEIHIYHELVDAHFDLIWHELDASIPEVVTLPTKLRVNLPKYKIDEVVKLNTWKSDFFILILTCWVYLRTKNAGFLILFLFPKTTIYIMMNLATRIFMQENLSLKKGMMIAM